MVTFPSVWSYYLTETTASAQFLSLLQAQCAKSNLRGASFISAYTSWSQSIIQDSQARNWWRDYRTMLFTASLLLCGSCCVSFLMKSRPTNLGNGAAHGELHLPPSISMKTISHRHAHRPIWPGKFFSWGSLSSGYSRLYQIVNED